MHQYFDSNNSGTHDACVSTTIGAERMAKATQWLKDNNFRGYMAEFGITDNLTCLAAGDGFLKHMKDNPVWIGWAYWAAGAWWGGYRFNVHPPRGVNQTALLLRYINSAPDPVPDQSPPAH